MRRDGPQLITYADRLAGDLAGLAALLDGPLDAAFRGVHVLPFYTPIDGADAGFDPDDHLEVDPRLGTWDDVARLADGGRVVMADLVVNHVSTRSAAFRSWVAHGEASPYAGLFLTRERVFGPDPDPDEIALVVRPRPGLPFTPVTLDDGSEHLLWTTFTSEQADIDVHDPQGRAHLLAILDRLAACGVRQVRLDAVGYAVKTAGTDCFLTPQTYAFVDELAGWCHDRGLLVLVEVHAPWQDQVAIAARVDRSYDFVLPPLLLHGLSTGDARPLVAWVDDRPTNVVTVLDTHDGIGIRDVARSGDRPGLLDDDQVDRLVETIHANTGGVSRRATGTSSSNVDLYQANATFLGALGGDHDALYAARVVQLLVPGTPQVYYVGLLHEGDDAALLDRTGVGRDVNRHRFTPEEVEAALASAPVARLLRLCELRATHPALDGDFARVDAPDGEVDLRWSSGTSRLRATVALRPVRVRVWVDGAERPDLAVG